MSMAKLSIPRLALVLTIFGIFLLPSTGSFAAPTWLEKLFSVPQQKAPKRRKPRPVAKVVTPLTAPVPEAKPDNEPPVDDAELPPDVVPAPKPTVLEDSVPDDPSATLPKNVDAVPVPEPNPRAASHDERPPQRPVGPVQGPPPPAFEASQEDEPPETAPIPEPNPRTATEKPDETAPADGPPEPPPLPDPRSALRPDPSGELPPEEIACRQRLHDLGVKFDNHPAQADPSGCSMPYPVKVKSLGKDIGLTPDAEMNCATAETAARFTQDVISPAARQVLGETLKSITHASAYVCRPRNGTRKLSEHAFGNALDIASFTLSDGTSISVELHPDAKAAGFLGKVRGAACGPFKTVLGPGSNADHAEHLHFDLAPRRRGGTVCE